MEEQIITVIQKIKIGYNCQKAKKEAIKEIYRGTNWAAITEGVICNEEVQFEAFKTGYIKVIE